MGQFTASEVKLKKQVSGKRDKGGSGNLSSRNYGQALEDISAERNQLQSIF